MRHFSKPTLVITFYTTAAAMETEKRFQSAGISGRLIPTPRALSSDCGMAWMTEPGEQERARALLSDLDVEGFYELLL